MHDDNHTAAPPCGDVRSSQCFHGGISGSPSFQTQRIQRRKRGPRSLHSRLRRFKRLEHIQNVIHGSSSRGACIDSGSILVTDGNDSSLVMAVNVDKSDSVTTSFDNSMAFVVESTPEVSSSSFSFSTVGSALVPGCSSGIVLDDLSTCFGSFSDVTLLHINIRGWRSHSDELSSYLHALPEKPKLIALNETFVNRSVSVFLPGYKIVGRRDRVTDEMNVHIDNLQSWGGILLCVSSELDGSVIEVLKFDTAERLWFILHCDIGPILLCLVSASCSRRHQLCIHFI